MNMWNFLSLAEKLRVFGWVFVTIGLTIELHFAGFCLGVGAMLLGEGLLQYLHDSIESIDATIEAKQPAPRPAAGAPGSGGASGGGRTWSSWPGGSGGSGSRNV